MAAQFGPDQTGAVFNESAAFLLLSSLNFFHSMHQVFLGERLERLEFKKTSTQSGNAPNIIGICFYPIVQSNELRGSVVMTTRNKDDRFRYPELHDFTNHSYHDLDCKQQAWSEFTSQQNND